MEIELDKRSVRQIRVAAADAIEEGDTEDLREDIIKAFSDDQIEEIERRLDGEEFAEFVQEVLDEWEGNDVEALFEALETRVGELGLDLAYEGQDEEDEDEDDDVVDDDLDDDAAEDDDAEEIDRDED